EDGVRALAAASRYAEWRRSDRGERVRPEGINRRAAHDVLETVLVQDPAGRELTGEETDALLSAYGIDVWPTVAVGSDEEAVEAYKKMRGTVVMKATSPLLQHQPGQGWIRTGLRHPKAVGAAYRDLDALVRPLGAEGSAPQQTAPSGAAVQI